MSRTTPPLLQNTLTIVLAGGQGERLHPLTKDRTKPSVPFAGSYRIIDFTLSNCIHSGMRQIYVLTQYKSQSLSRHIREGWNLLHRELNEFIDTIPPQHRTPHRWYEGTADAIFQNIHLFERHKPNRLLLLSGDHVYRMNYQAMIEFHIAKKADVTIGTYEFPRAQASSFGVMQVDEEDRVMDFIEKPSEPPSIPGHPDRSLINMGIYVFNTSPLLRAVIEDAKGPEPTHDLGINILPKLVRNPDVTVYSYSFSRQFENAYWRDVGNISGYYNAAMDLLDPEKTNDLFTPDWPIRTYTEQLFPSRFCFEPEPAKRIERCIISGGCSIEGSLRRCVLSPKVRVGPESQLDGCVVFNGTSIGKRCRIKNTIIDKSVKIPDNSEIGYDLNKDRKQFLVFDEKIVVIPKGYTA